MIEWHTLVIPALVGAVASIVINVVGQGVSASIKKSDEVRARKLDDLEFFERTVFELRDMAKDYWSSDDDEALVAAAIVGRLTFISDFAALNDYFPAGVVDLVNALDETCTSGQFQSTGRVAEPFRATEIEQAAYRLVHAARRARTT